LLIRLTLHVQSSSIYKTTVLSVEFVLFQVIMVTVINS